MKLIKLFVVFTLVLLIPIVFTFCGSDSGTTEPTVSSLDTANKLTSFTIVDNNIAVVSIDEETKTIKLRFPFFWSDFDSITINFAISIRASSNLVSGNTYNFSSPQTFVITSATGLENIYTISAECCSGTALIISDTQNDIIPLFNQEEFFASINTVIDKAHAAGVQTYYVMLKNLVSANHDSTRWHLPAQLHFYSGSILIDKDDIFNAFEMTTTLHKDLMKKGLGKVIITGVSSMGCVIGTCRGAAELKYDVTLIRDAHAEPIGYRTIEAVEQCNQVFVNENLGRIITADELTFD